MDTNKLRDRLQKGELDGILEQVYVDPAKVAGQRIRYEKALDQFLELFGEGEVEVYSAPGRSEVGGNHTDHQHGRVLATSVNLDAIAFVRKTVDYKIELKSDGYPMLKVDLADLATKEEEEGTSLALIRGMAYGLQEKGYQLGGFCAYVTSDVLGGAGLSSSAAFEVLIGTIFSGLYNGGTIDSVEIAKTAQFSENVYFGKPCGLMDQMACAVGGLVAIDFMDPTQPVVHPVEVDFSGYHHSLCITDTKGSHANLTDEYAAVPVEMKQVASFFGKEVLRQVEPQVFFKSIPLLRERFGDRPVLRALHFFRENDRAAAEALALEEGHFADFLKLVKESGESSFQFLQNVYTSKDVAHQAVSLGLAVSTQLLAGYGFGADSQEEKAIGHGVCRVHGGGFAGTIQAFVADDFVETYQAAMNHLYGEGACHVLKIRPVGGVKIAG